MTHTATPTPAPAKPADCGCKGHRHGDARPHECTCCCRLDDFVRPRYFCGHLLTDADLRQDQRYFREKNRLYHRALHGHGVVCGLKLSCHPRCAGHVLIGEGYAIDPCGNDLVLAAPASLDVLDWVRRHCAPPGRPAPAKPARAANGSPSGAGTEDQPCPDIECYYVVACYHEEEFDFTAPFVPGCQPPVADCEATRIREGVRFDLVEQLPPDDGWIGALKKCLTTCNQFYADDALKGLQNEKGEPQGAIADVIGSKIDPAKHKDYQDLYTKLWAALYRQDRRAKDSLQCNRPALDKPKKPLPTPPTAPTDEERRNADAAAKYQSAVTQYQQGVKDSFQEVFDRLNDAYVAVQDCVAEALVFPCPEARADACVVLGSVEVQDGKLVRVCNCPRSYVWSFANFFAVLAATLLGGRTAAGYGADHCCPTLRWRDWRDFLGGLRKGWSVEEALLTRLGQLEAITKNVCTAREDVTRAVAPLAPYGPGPGAGEPAHAAVPQELANMVGNLYATVQNLAARVHDFEQGRGATGGGTPPPSAEPGGGQR
jgi:hypothetical protein